MNCHGDCVKAHPSIDKGLGWVQLAFLYIWKEAEQPQEGEKLRGVTRTLGTTVCKDQPVVQVAVKADPLLTR